jgi:hypothetical protein
VYMHRRAIHKAAGILEAAYIIHGRADSLRSQDGAGKTRWSNADIANLLDALADELKNVAVSRRDEAIQESL